MKHQFVLFLMAALLSISACAQKVDTEAETAAVKAVVDQFAQVWETEDMALFSKIIAHDAGLVFYGTDAAEHFVGWPALQEASEEMFTAFENTKITVRDQVIDVHPSGTVAWFSQEWDWDLVAEGQPVSAPGGRFTGVLEKRNGDWMFVQFHNSVPVAGQVAEY